ncbi:phage Gp37/Gp68 family protein [Streptomyces sp. NPDC102487]|uniref:phage Gp37/Gp68 family protein n=1 Tax=Streptomyces sp. NPDC102487 TaxID=3366182 RepID=UPI00381C328A
MTKIEWADEVWNPTTGCDRVGPGCDNCYALGMAKRLKAMGAAKYQTDGNPETSGPGFGVALHPETFMQPLRWKKPRKIFVNSMSDLFHDGVDTPSLHVLFGVMAATPQHTYQILTKRHARMRSLLNDPNFSHMVRHRADVSYGRQGGPWTWPLPNVWLGVSVENQKWADIRIPALAATPAAVRFLSCEPLLGPVDLTRWMAPLAPMPAEQAPATWAEWTWPDWMPAKLRQEIENFWSDSQGRSPRHWIRAMLEEGGAPPFGARLTMGDGFGSNPPKVTGRFVYCWGNIGRLVLDDDPNREYAYTSFGQRTRENSRTIDWVIAGGESGHHARAMHPDWARSIRDQAVAADVAFFFKQWGEWGPAPFSVRVCDPREGWKGTAEELTAAKADSEARGATHAHTGGWFEEDGERQYWLHEIGHKPWSLERCALPPGTAAMRRWGKKAAGRELDGRTWDEMPAVRA